MTSSLEEQEPVVTEVPAVAKSVDVKAEGEIVQVDRIYSGTVNCDVAQTGAHKLPECVRAVTTADELELIELGADGLDVPLK